MYHYTSALIAECCSPKLKNYILNLFKFIFSSAENFKNIVVERVGKNSNVGLIKLNRPRALNALCDELMTEVNQALDQFEGDTKIGCVILTGSEKAFAGN